MMEDPFADLTNDGEKIYHHIASPVEIALKIGANQETVEKDMRVLKKLGLYDYRATGWEGYNLSAAEADAEAERLKQRKKVAETSTPKGGGLNNPQESLNSQSERLNKPQESLNNQSERLNNLPKTLEPLPQADSKTPHTSSDFSDFLNTLSEGERERFLEFGKTEAGKLKNPEVVLTDPWIAKYHQEIYRKFKTSEAATTPSSDEASQAKQQEKLEVRKAAAEFLQRDQKNSDRESNCVPAPQKSPVEPQETAEVSDVSNQPKDNAKEPKAAGKGFAAVDHDLAAKLAAKNAQKKPQGRKSRFTISEQEMNNARRDDEAAPPHD
jgi:hypothetical protein